MGAWDRTLIVTDSWDATADIVALRLEDKSFRLNSDLIRDYKIQWRGSSDFEISDPTGRSVRSHNVGSIYWRKPFSSDMYLDRRNPEYFFYSECRYLIREIYNVSRAAGAFALIEEGAERRLGKIRQLLLAREHFDVPEWMVTLGSDYTAPEFTVAKSLSGEQTDAENVLYTTRIDGQDLDPAHVWFTQVAIDKTADVTVCFVQGNIFAFRLATIPGVTDWRATIGSTDTLEWLHFELPASIALGIRNFMAKCDLQFGRLDFVLKEDRFFFLEVNPNGQWAWLDLDDRWGLVTAVVDAVRADGVFATQRRARLTTNLQ